MSLVTKFDKVISSLLVIIPLCVAILLAVLALLDTIWLKEFFDSMARDGRSERMTLHVISEMQQMARNLAILWAIVVLVVWQPRFDMRSMVLSELRTTGKLLSTGWNRLCAWFQLKTIHAFIILAISTLFFGLILLWIDQPIRTDEGISYIRFSSHPLSFILTQYTSPNNHVLHNVAAHFSTLILGPEPWAIRLPVIISGVLLIPVTYLTVARFAGRGAALLATCLVGSSFYLVDIATNARGYPIINLLSLLLLALTVNVHKENWQGRILLFVLLGSIGVLTNPTMVFPLGVILIFVGLGVLTQQPKSEWFNRLFLLATVAVATLVASLILYTPILLFLGGANETATSLAVDVSPQEGKTYILMRFWSSMLGSQVDAVINGYWFYGYSQFIKIIIIGIWGIGLLLPRKIGGNISRLALASVLSPSIFVVVTGMLPPFWTQTYLLVFILIVVASTLSVLISLLIKNSEKIKKTVLIALGISIVVTNLSLFNDRPSPDKVPWYIGYSDANAAAIYLESVLQPGDKIVAAPIRIFPVVYYMLLNGNEDARELRIDYFDPKALGDIYLISTGDQEEARLIELLIERGFSKQQEIYQLPMSNIIRYKRPNKLE